MGMVVKLDAWCHQ